MSLPSSAPPSFPSLPLFFPLFLLSFLPLLFHSSLLLSEHPPLYAPLLIKHALISVGQTGLSQNQGTEMYQAWSPSIFRSLQLESMRPPVGLAHSVTISHRHWVTST